MSVSARARLAARVVLAAVLVSAALGAAEPAQGEAARDRAAEEGGWSSLGGPWDASGDARLLAVDAAVEHTVYVVVESSGISTLYRTQDDGATWASLWLIDKRLGALVARGGVLYAGISGAAPGEDAIVRSGDGGATWTAVLTATATTTIRFFDLAPSPSPAAYAAASVGSSGVVLSSADGLGWESRYSIPGQMVRVGINPADPGQVFASGQNSSAGEAQVYRSDDGGAGWATVLSVAGEEIQDFLQVHPLAPQRIFATTRPPNCCPPDPAHLWRSDDGGDTWTTISTGYLYNLAFAEPDSIYSIFDAVSVTHDASSPNPTWIDRGVPFSEWTTGRAVDARPSEPVIYAGLHVSGIFRSTDDAQTFQEANAGIQSLLRPNALAAGAQSPGALYAATDKGVFRSEDDGDSWASTFPRIVSRDVAVRPGGSGFLLATVQDASVEYPAASPVAYRSQDGGQSWELMLSHSEEAGRTNGGYGVAFDPSDSERAFATTCAWTPGDESNNHLLRTIDAGETWEDLLFTRGQFPGVVVVEVAADGTVYLGGKEGFMGGGRAILYRSEDHGDSWVEVYTHESGWRVLSLSVDPQAPDHLLMIVAENEGATHLLQSDDRGDTWQELAPAAGARSLPSQGGRVQSGLPGLQVVAHDPQTAGRLFVGAAGPTVLASPDNGQSWSEVGGWPAALVAPEVSALVVDRVGGERTLYAGLGGAGLTGAWRRTAASHQLFLPLVTRLDPSGPRW